jgi:competence protein ComEA
MAEGNDSSAFGALLRHPMFRPVALGLSAVFVLASVVLMIWQIERNSNASAALAGNSTSGSQIAVYIVGAVNHPGVYHLPASARVQDLVAAAGGALPQADLVRVNMAAPLFDGEEVYVPLIGEPYPSTVGDSGIRVNINLASATTLRTQLGISSKTADAIVAYRQKHGPFTSVDQLLLVPISRTIYDRIKDLVTV